MQQWTRAAREFRQKIFTEKCIPTLISTTYKFIHRDIICFVPLLLCYEWDIKFIIVVSTNAFCFLYIHFLDGQSRHSESPELAFATLHVLIRCFKGYFNILGIGQSFTNIDGKLASFTERNEGLGTWKIIVFGKKIEVTFFLFCICRKEYWYHIFQTSIILFVFFSKIYIINT